MLVMMPQVHCAEGSRVRNIKKHFEVLSGDPLFEANVNGACALTYPSECEVLEKTPNIRPHSLPQTQCQVSRTSKPRENIKPAVVKHEKCNIKRTPAFRCDRIVKGKNVTGQLREKHVSVEDKVKLFEDGKTKLKESTSLKVLSDRQDARETKSISTEQKDLSPGNNSHCSKTTTQPEKLESKFIRSHDMRYSPPTCVNNNAVGTEVSIRFSHPSAHSVPKDRMVSENIKRRNGFCNAQRDVSAVKNVPGENNLNNILCSPLPRGPPPRKPPRTFAHLSKTTNEAPKNHPNIKTDAAIKVSPSTTSIPTLIRSKTESQIQLRSKLENALSKVPSGNVTPNRTSMIETKQQPWNRSNPVKPPTKPDLSPSALLVGCLSLGCVNSNPYEEVGAQRKGNTRPGDRRESLDIRLSSSDVVEARNNLVSLVRSQSEDHIYAVPFGDSKSPGKCIMREDFQHNNVDIRRNGNLETFKVAVNLSPPESNGLHYMCTPILSQGKLSSIDEDISHTDVGKRLNSMGIVKRVPKSSPHLHLAGLMKSAEDSGLADCNQIHSAVGHNLDGSQRSVTSDSPLDEIKESSLAHSVGKDSFNKGSKTSLCSPSTETEEENGEEDHDPMTKEMLEKRKGYVRRVCSMFQKMQMENSSYVHSMTPASYLSKVTQNPRTSVDPASNQCVPSAAQSCMPYQVQNPFPHLFECVLLVGLTLSPNQDQGKTYEPYIKSKFPPDVLVPPWIEHLCFPDATDWPLTNAISSSKGNLAEDLKKKDTKGEDELDDLVCRGCTYSLVITGADGNRRFGYCRRVMPEGGSLCLPLNYCLISPYRANGFYFKVLAELESRHGLPEAEKTAFLQELYSCPLPGPGQIPCPSVSSSSSPSSFLASLRRPFDTRLEERDAMELFCSLEVAIFLDVFASLLLERKVILTSASLSKLSSCIEALQTVLYPFSWQHTFIPVLPAPMLDICHAPTPYIIGVLKGCNGQIPSITLDEGIMVDLDTSNCIQRVGDEGSILPSRIKRALQAALRLVTGITPTPRHNQSKNTLGQDGDSPVRNVLVSEAFLRMFLMVVGHYPNHISVQQDGLKVFQRESFIKAMPFHGVQMFLEWFTETAMFSAFIQSRLEGRPESGDGIFEQRAHKFCEELEKDALLFLKNYKAITKKNKKFGDRLKDWAPFS